MDVQILCIKSSYLGGSPNSLYHSAPTVLLPLTPPKPKRDRNSLTKSTGLELANLMLTTGGKCANARGCPWRTVGQTTGSIAWRFTHTDKTQGSIKAHLWYFPLFAWLSDPEIMSFPLTRAPQPNQKNPESTPLWVSVPIGEVGAP